MDFSIKELFKYVEDNNFSDLHLKSDSKPFIRTKSWDLEILEEFNGITVPNFSNKDIEKIISMIAWEEGLSKFKENLELDTSFAASENARYRVNCYKDSFWNSVALRLIPVDVPTIDEIGLWENVKQMLHQNKWIILVTGPTWSWKSTNLASMIDYINTNFKKHIITIEDPIEFSFKNKNCLINQREVWSHTKWFWNAIKSSLREDPDIVMVWEMRDLETIKAALTLAETGHLVISTLHTNDTVQSVDRIIDVFPTGQQAQIKMQLAMSLVWIISQRLVKRKDKDARIPAREILINNDAIRNLIITWKTHQMYSVLEVSDKKGMILMDKYLAALYKKWLIDESALNSYGRDKELIKSLI